MIFLAIVSVVLIALAALFSGLNLGLMSLDTYELKRKADLGDKNARKIYQIRSRGNLLLVTLLTGNVAVISALSIVLDSEFHGLIAGILTTALITIFGEIIPQAILARYALSLGAKFVGLVKIIIFILYPICGPIAWALDKLLGDELPTVYSKHELTKIIEEHRDHKHSNIDRDEVRIARGALSFGDRQIKDVMTPRSVAMMLDEKQTLDDATIKRLKSSGFSRIPVYRHGRPDDIGGVLYLKDLVGKSVATKTAGKLARPKVYFVGQEDNLDDTLNAFLKTRNHLFVVVDEFAEIHGIITIEDVLEEIIDREIADEFDNYDDLRKVARRLKRQTPAKR